MVNPEAIARVVQPGTTGYVISIFSMDPWFFWARPSTLGLSAEHARAIMDGSATPDQICEMQRRANAARLNLIEAPVGETFWRPS